MKPVSIFFLNSVLIFLSIKILNLAKVEMPSWITSYVNDFLCMPLVLFICLKTVQYIKKDMTIPLPLMPILVLTSFYAIYFEGYMPGVEERYTADWVDVIMYFCGALVFYFIQFISKKKASKTDASILNIKY